MKKFCNAIWEQAILLVLACICLVVVTLQNNQPILPILIHQSFSGMYSQDGGEWKSLDDVSNLSGFDGDVILRGHFDNEIPEGFLLNFYVDHIGVEMWINGEFYMCDALMEVGLKSFVCGRRWNSWLLPEITPEDEVEFLLHNPHSFGNKSAYQDFLRTMNCTVGSTELLEKSLEPYGKPFRITGFVLIILAAGLIGAFLAFVIKRTPGADMLWNSGIMLLLAGGFMLLDTVDVFFWSRLVVFNTYCRQLCMMLFVFWLEFCAAQCLTEKRRTASKIVVGISFCLNLFLITISFTGVTVIYDTCFWWTVVQAMICIIMPGFCIWELRMREEKKRKVPVSFLLLFVTVLMDMAGIGSSMISRGTCTKIGFVVLTILYMTYLLRAIIKYKKNAIRVEKLEKELENERIALMISQIQPHFLYNTLDTIYYLCGTDAEKAQKAVEEFSEYLRVNLSALSSRKLVSFESEWKHVETYLKLEKMSSEDELQYVFDIQVSHFMIPVLSVQPLVENAVKHGLGKKRGGGTVLISTREFSDRYEIVVKDDGVGFDVNRKTQDKRVHIGIRNVKERISSLCGGTLEITSIPGEGTTAVIILPKGDTKDDSTGS